MDKRPQALIWQSAEYAILDRAASGFYDEGLSVPVRMISYFSNFTNKEQNNIYGPSKHHY